LKIHIESINARIGFDMGKQRSRNRHDRDKSDTAKREPSRRGIGPIGKVLGPLTNYFKGHWKSILILVSLFFMALVLRSYFYYDVSVDPPSEKWGYMLSGNDPFYHKRVVDYVQEEHVHLRNDFTLTYPTMGGNPRAPIFDWSIAISGKAFSFWGGEENATWMIILLSPALWGALTLIPVYFITKGMFGRKAGFFATFLFALMPAHIERSPFGFSDHDSMTVFFLVCVIFFLFRAFETLKGERFVSNWKKPREITYGCSDFLANNKVALCYATLSGFSIGAMALVWKGFPYIVVIIMFSYLFILIFNRLRNVDSFGIFILVFTAMTAALLISAPYYFGYTTSEWLSAFYMYLAIIIISVIFIPTIDYPWVIVFPVALCMAGIGMISLNFISPATYDSLFTGGGYFVKSKLYGTIAEAQAPEFSRMVTSYGMVTFYLALIGLLMAAISLPKHWKPSFFFILIWCGVAIYMAISASRFMFNASPVFAILGGWIAWRMIEKWDPKMHFLWIGGLALLIFVIFFSLENADLSKDYAEFWADFRESFLWIFNGIVILGLLGFFALMRYYYHKEKYEIRKIGVALTMVFIILVPHALYGVDASIPYESKSKYDPSGDFTGSFGHSAVSEHWQATFDWLSDQDREVQLYDRPAFISWWDYGFWCIYLGEHPTVAENFQGGYQCAGSFIAAQNESEAISLLSVRLIEGNLRRNIVSNLIKDFTMGTEGKFIEDTESPPALKPLLISYLDPEDPVGHPNTKELLNILLIQYNTTEAQTDMIDEVEGDPDRYGQYTATELNNAMYAKARMLILDLLGHERLVEFHHDVQMTTGTSIRYFAVDNRMFPYSASNTGIFYAPITLADRDVEDFLEYRANAEYREDPEGDWIPFEGNPITTERLESEVDIWGAENIRIINYDLFYRDGFYDSMFYKAYVGYSGEDIGISDGVPSYGPAEELRNYQPAQGWNLKHFKLVYRTVWYSPESQENASFPDDYMATSQQQVQDIIREKQDAGEFPGHYSPGFYQGVFMLKYYDGAVLRGQVETVEGTPIANARVTVHDEFGIPHDMVVTDDEGWYNVTLPFGNTRIYVTRGEMDSPQDKLAQFQVNDEIWQQTGQQFWVPELPLNVTDIDVSDDQAMRRTPNWRIDRGLIVRTGTYNASVYLDRDLNEEFDEDIDDILEDVEISLEDALTFESAYTKKTDVDGKLSISDIVPGRYGPIVTIDGQPLVKDPVTISGEQTEEAEYGIKPASLQGNVTTVDEEPLEDVKVTLTRNATGDFRETLTNDLGQYIFIDMFPGNHTITVKHPGHEMVTQYWTMEEGEMNGTNITVYPLLEVSGKTFYDIDNDGYDTSDILGNVWVTLSSLSDDRSYLVRSDADGDYETFMRAGNYTFQALYTLGSETLVSVGRVTVSEEMQPVDVGLVRGIRMMGRVRDVMGENITTAKVTVYSDLARINSLPAGANGTFLAVVPPGEFVFTAEYISEPGKINYSAIKTVEVAEGDVNVPLVLVAHKSTFVNGSVYWDKDGDGNLTFFEPVDEVIEEEEDLLEGTRQDDSEGTNQSEPINEGLGGIQVRFIGTNGTMLVETDEMGYFEERLDFGEWEIVIDDERFSYYNQSFDVNNDTFETDLRFDVSLEPNDIEIMATVGYDSDGDSLLSASEMVPDIEVMFEPVSSGGVPLTFKTDATGGLIDAFVVPGVYNIGVDMFKRESGTLVRYKFELDNVNIDMEESTLSLSIYLDKSIIVTGQVVRKETPGDSVNVSGVKVEFLDSDGVERIVEADVNGTFNITLPQDQYTIWVENIHAGLTYVHGQIEDISAANSVFDITLQRGIRLNGTAFVDEDLSGTIGAQEGVNRIEILFIKNGTAKTETFQGGSYELILVPNQVYTVRINFSLKENITSEVMTRYWHESLLTIGGEDMVYNISLVRQVEVQGNVYFDRDLSEVMDEGEYIDGVEVEFYGTSGHAEGERYTLITDDTGYFSGFVTIGDYTVSTEYSELDLMPVESKLTVNRSSFVFPMEVSPAKATLFYTAFVDMDNDSLYDPQVDVPMNEWAYTFSMNNPSSENLSGSVESEFETMALAPGNYNVHAYGFDRDGELRAVVTSLDVGLDAPSNMSLRFSDAVNVHGSIFFRDTYGEIHSQISQKAVGYKNKDFGITLRQEQKEGSLHLDYNNGVFSAVLPVGNYTVISTYLNWETDRNMTYTNASTIIVNESISEYVVELNKERLYSLSLELVDMARSTVIVPQGGKTTIQFMVTNTGNHPVTVDLAVDQVPQGWDNLISDGQVYLDIDETRRFSVSITTTLNALALNELSIRASTTDRDSTDKRGTSDLPFNINTPADFVLEFFTEEQPEVGVYFGTSIPYNFTIDNTNGNAQEIVTLSLSPYPEVWNISLRDQDTPVSDPDVSKVEDGWEVFVSPFTMKNVTMDIIAPLENQSSIGARLSMIMEARADSDENWVETLNFYPAISAPDLIIDKLDIINEDLKEDPINITVNAYIRSANVKVNSVKVQFLVDDEIYENITLFEIPQNGVELADFIWVVPENDTGEHEFKVIVDPDGAIDESVRSNNMLKVTIEPGVEETEPFNWRPVYAAVFAIVAMLVLFLIFRWRRPY